MYMKLKDGKAKVLTLSYDDGVVQDIRFIKILDAHGIKATFNINTGMYLPEDAVRDVFDGRLKLSEAQSLYKNGAHEVAVHTLTHPFLQKLRTEKVITEVLEDRKNIEEQYGVLARGMAYPYGKYNDEVVSLLEKCGICYARTTKATEGFGFPENWLTLDPTCHHRNSNLMELAQKVVEKKPRNDADNWLFYVWGHSYEFDRHDNWEVIEKFAQYVGGKEDIWYATNGEIYEYVKAYEQLQTSVDERIIYNPTMTDVWVVCHGQTYCIKGGQTLRI